MFEETYLKGLDEEQLKDVIKTRDAKLQEVEDIVDDALHLDGADELLNKLYKIKSLLED